MENLGYTKFIQFIFSPEDTCSEFPRKTECGRLAGQIKAIFWIMIAISLSVLISIFL